MDNQATEITNDVKYSSIQNVHNSYEPEFGKA